ncbi:MAG: 3-deoxy-7-phosphoheptulonate synthase [Actinomycetota bacterium]|nr:3-deoxy-7-phosphoheptulonate synthase [Actinomycetota bacterium]
MIWVSDVPLGRDAPLAVIAGPCSVESLEQYRETAVAVANAGASLLRGGAFKPRSSPYSFQGLGLSGLKIMRRVADELGLGVVTEAMGVEDVELVAEFTDMVQIGARNMENAPLLEAAARCDRPVLLKRGITATIEEVMVAVETVQALGDGRVVVCERGSRTFEPSLRNSVDISAVAELRLRCNLPVVLDPSHGTGRTDLVRAVALAGVAAGADGLMVEVHPNPPMALSDGFQSLAPADFRDLMTSVQGMAAAVDRPC